MTLHALPAFEDNYVWLIAGPAGGVVVVDPGDPAPVRAAAARGLRPAAILVTHHHADHIGGVEALAAEFGLPVWAPDDPRMPALARTVRDGDRIEPTGTGLSFEVLSTPGHTRSHVCFFGAGTLFCGDTLFSLGCGRLFEGTPAKMLASLDRLAMLPGDTRVCCAHEYTASNGRFALAVEPGNPALAARMEEVRAARAAGRPTLPTTIAGERACNPFLRVREPAVRAALAARLGRAPADDVEAFATLRAWKDGFTA